MILEDLIKVIDDVDDKFVIFQKSELSINSEIALFEGEDSANVSIQKNNINYLYLLEVDIVKEFLDGWLKRIDIKPSAQEIALRVFQYAINDA
ncbi:hypothetical protein FO440_02645 [Mucilaginibacter corticis]|uniref:Uncharacterized protein n=1 Tax=Mucilaginibacter corticis TaxID=2597670 RepID=A0A556MT98_9SPHI|nr:hypothetical protein [Mucilaginibacter corticis]TSJ43105.1 hypothetical protein FO440_02645 [Mucilaginibacter corticis]